MSDALSDHIFDTANVDCFFGAPTPHFKDDCPAEAIHFAPFFFRLEKFQFYFVAIADAFVDLYFSLCLFVCFFVRSLSRFSDTHDNWISYNQIVDFSTHTYSTTQNINLIELFRVVERGKKTITRNHTKNE